MKGNFKRSFSKIVRLVLVLTVVVFIENGSNKVEYKIANENLNRTLDLTSMALRVKEENESNLFYALDTYTGDLTGYAANCPLCGGRLACAPNYPVLNNGVDTYEDQMYGTVHIVASSKNLACGSIVRFESSKISNNPIYAIVLDRGVRGNSLDLLTINEDIARNKVGRLTITYDVLRSGWEK